MFTFLDNIALASLVTVAGIVGGVIALAQGSIDFEQFLIGIGALSGGAGVLGHARTQAGKGLKKPKRH
jgi:hypothetical protein